MPDTATKSPKIELHLHLEGAAPPDFMRRLAGEQRRDISGIIDEADQYSFKDFNDFLRVYEVATTLLKTPDHFACLLSAVAEELAQQGAIYAELFISPDFCGAGDLAAWREYLAAMEEAAVRARAIHGLELRGIVTAIRHFGPETARAPAICAAETAGSFITGFGMGGDELAGTPADFAWSYACAREAGLGLTIHAGEWGGAASVRQALDALAPQRIGHGVQAIDDPALVDRLAREGIVLESCPGSNVFLGVTPSWADHPIEQLRAGGVKVTVSTDDPPFFRTDLTREFAMLADTFAWAEPEFAEVTKNALAAAFCDEATRDELRKRLEGPRS